MSKVNSYGIRIFKNNTLTESLFHQAHHFLRHTDTVNEVGSPVFTVPVA